MSSIPFPLVIPVNEEQKIYKGYVTIKNKEHFIQVQLGKEGKLSSSKELEQLVQEQIQLIKAKLQQATDIASFLTELKEILEAKDTLSTVTNKFTSNHSSERYRCIYNELIKIGFDKINKMNDTMDEILFQTIDNENRIHLLKVILPMEYPYVSPQIQCELPTALSTHTTKSSNIHSIYTEFQQSIVKYQPLFNCLDDLDKHMRIIEPDHPKRSETFRKIALGYHCSLYMDLGPDYSIQKGKPTNIRFFGNLTRVQELKSKWKSFEWNKDESIHINLLDMFQIVSSSQPNNNDDYTNTNDLECGICYSYKLDHGELPEVICSNLMCNRGFHSICLYEWLRSNPSTTTSFNILFGKCPYCNEKITIKAIIK